MKVVTAREMSHIDRTTIEEFALPGSVLMNNAGRAIANVVFERGCCDNVLIFCGAGNNGGDGLIAAYYLHSRGLKVTIVIPEDCESYEQRLSPDSLLYYNVCVKNSIEIVRFRDFKPGESYGVVIDAIFGTGFRGQPHGVGAEMIDCINGLNCFTISADIPSGMECDGKVYHDRIVRANHTVTMGLPKVSMVTWPGKGFCGQVDVAPLGFPETLLSSDSIKRETTEASLIGKILQGSFLRECNIHKGERGRHLFVGGFPGMEGAIMLSVGAAFKSGAGLVTILTHHESRSVIAGKIPEAMTKATGFGEGNEIASYMNEKKINSIVIGPGLGRSDEAGELFYSILNSLDELDPGSIVIDGDGLFFYANYLRENKPPKNWSVVLTPHLMEASRFFTDVSVHDIEGNRIFYAEELARFTGASVVLKGPCSISSDGERSFINVTGNSAMATAGSGDVLSGICASFLSRFRGNATVALAAAVFVHGMAGDILLDKRGLDSFSAGEMLHEISGAMANISQGGIKWS